MGRLRSTSAVEQFGVAGEVLSPAVRAVIAAPEARVDAGIE